MYIGSIPLGLGWELNDKVEAANRVLAEAFPLIDLTSGFEAKHYQSKLHFNELGHALRLERVLAALCADGRVECPN